MGFWDAVASAGRYADNLHLAPDNHSNTSSLNFFTDRKLFLADNQQCQSIKGKHVTQIQINRNNESRNLLTSLWMTSWFLRLNVIQIKNVQYEYNDFNTDRYTGILC